MSAPLKLASFAAVLAALFAGGAAAGDVIDPNARGGSEHVAMPAKEPAGHGHGATSSSPSEVDIPAESAAHGLAIADRGLQLELERTALRRGRATDLRFRVIDRHGDAVRDFDVTHEKRMHLIIARRDLTGFQHLHPSMAGDGTWTVPVTVNDAGSYRVFADFSYQEAAITLATDLHVDGRLETRPLPAPADTAKSDGGYDVRLDTGTARAGQEANLRFEITRDGETVHTEPYLGAGGHLVALREGDLGFLHVHPSEHDESDEHDDAVGFGATFPTAGRYRLFLQFKHEGRIQTVAFTTEVAR